MRNVGVVDVEWFRGSPFSVRDGLEWICPYSTQILRGVRLLVKLPNYSAVESRGMKRYVERTTQALDAIHDRSGTECPPRVADHHVGQTANNPLTLHLVSTMQLKEVCLDYLTGAPRLERVAVVSRVESGGIGLSLPTRSLYSKAPDVRREAIRRVILACATLNRVHPSSVVHHAD